MKFTWDVTELIGKLAYFNSEKRFPEKSWLRQSAYTDSERGRWNGEDQGSADHRHIRPIAEMLSAKLQLNNMRLPVSRENRLHQQRY